ncbi:hypothetical protein [Rufibacter ruber]|uniref:hypothetical protein n=1 Tax=Rufibacter ruber TaxID=1783499 RepID=UPI000AB5FB9F|nr:hypothetical protein [Rufibacter ruber]
MKGKDLREGIDTFLQDTFVDVIKAYNTLPPKDKVNFWLSLYKGRDGKTDDVPAFLKQLMGGGINILPIAPESDEDLES